MDDSKRTAGTTEDDDLPWIEVTEPLADAMHTLATCVEGESRSLKGASIAVTDSGTLLLNQKAWALCKVALQQLPRLKTAETRLENAKVVRFLLINK
jgi:hypothetical protein